MLSQCYGRELRLIARDPLANFVGSGATTLGHASLTAGHVHSKTRARTGHAREKSGHGEELHPILPTTL